MRTRRRAARASTMRGAIGALAVIAVMGAARAAPAPLERRSTRGVIDQLVWLRH